MLERPSSILCRSTLRTTTMDITCARCGAPIPAEDVNIASLAAKCRSCNAVFSIAGQVGGGPGWAPAPQLDVPLPDRFVVERQGGALQITWRWFTPVAFVFAAFGLFWSLFVCFWIGMVLAAGVGSFALFGAIHAAVGVFLIYTAIAMFVNSSHVDASYGSLSVRHGPLPWPGSRTLPTASIRQIYGVERVRRSRRSTSTVYDLQAITAEGGGVTLIKSLQSVEQALFLEQQLERFLGIADAPVPGELRK